DVPSPSPRGPVGFVGAPGISGIGGGVSAPAGMTGGDGCQGCTGGTGVWGPGNYNDIVAAKAASAEQLKYGVGPILEGVGATYGYYVQQAQETLYQQMLIQLSEAYNVNAVVQYPVDVQSPCQMWPGATATTPRVSGKVTPELYVNPQGETAASDTLRLAAAERGVSTA